jgi:hypothetical protein
LRAQDKGFGGGLIFGEPFGVEFKRWIDETNAIEAAFASSVATKNNRLTIFVDYLWHEMEYIKTKEKFHAFYGVGILSSVRTDETALHAVRGVAGLLWYPNKRVPMDFFIEAAPAIVLYPYFGMVLNMGAGCRYYFTTK